ncbi:MAG TPA: Pr6Pr family membrane protein [Candidatus Saccharimonadales bacterium]|nr:Pr6Pr family membrane protein [Candidatus Saccharimonadales bacterium]
MQKHKLLGTARITLGLLATAAIVVQLLDSIEKGRSLINFFSFFTIESNILAAIMLLVLGAYEIIARTPSKQFAFLRGAITLYMTMTGIIYAMLLSGNEVSLQTTIPWVNIVLHYVMPAVILADWLIFPPKEYILFKRAALWFAFPALYLVYSLIRGGFTQWYPYPFINPVQSGWPTVVAMSLIIAIATFSLTALLILRTKKSKPQRSM